MNEGLALAWKSLGGSVMKNTHIIMMAVMTTSTHYISTVCQALLSALNVLPDLSSPLHIKDHYQLHVIDEKIEI